VLDLDTAPLSASDAAESSLLGGLILAPFLRRRVGTLRSADFREHTRALIFDALLGMDGPVTANLLWAELEARGAKPPAGTTWPWVIGELLSDPQVDEDTLPGFVKTIKEAAAKRRLEGLRKG